MQIADAGKSLPRSSKALAAFLSSWALLLGWALSPPAQAQSPAATAQAFNVTAGPLADALQQFGEQAKLRFSAAPSILDGKTATSVVGSYTIDEALRLLLTASGLSYTFADAQTVLVVAPPPGQRMIGPLRVQGDQEAGTGWRAGPNGSSDPSATEGSKSYYGREVKIGANGAPKSVMDSTQSVSVVTRQQIEDQHVFDLASALERAPGITVVQGSSQNESSFLSRGFEITSVQIDGGSPLIASSGSFGYSSRGDISAIYDHVEILRGSDGISSGFGQPGGTVNLVRKRPLDHFQTVVEASAGSWNTYRTSIDVAGPIALDGKIRGRVVGAYLDEKSFLDVAKDRNGTLYGIVEFDLSPSMMLTLGGNVSDQPSTPINNGLPTYSDGRQLGLPRSAVLSPAWNRSDLHGSEVFAQLEQHFGKNWLAKLDYSRVGQRSQSKFASPFGTIDPATGDGSLLRSSADNWTNTQTLASLTVNGKFELVGRQQEVVMGYSETLLDSHLDSFDLDAQQLPINIFHFDPATSFPEPAVTDLADIDHVHLKQSGAYAKVNLHPLDPLHVSIGVRWSAMKTHQTRAIPAFDYSSDATYNTKHKSLAFASVSDELSQRFTVYASYSDIFEDQSYLVRADGSPLPPLTGKTYETGLRFQSADRKLGASIAAYLVKRRNFQVFDETAFNPDLLNCCYAVGSATETSKGIDAEVSGELSPGLQLTASINFNDNHADSNDALAPGKVPVSSVTPRRFAKLWASYRLRQGALDHFIVSAGFDAQSKNSQTVGVVTVAQGGYALAHARLAYEVSSAWTAALNVDNLFDRHYYSTVGGLYFNNWLGAPRAVTVSLRGQF